MADGFMSLAAHILVKAVPHALQTGEPSDALVEALLTLVQEATEAWFDPADGSGMVLATKEFMRRARKNQRENEDEDAI